MEQLRLDEVAELVSRYSKEHDVGLLTAFTNVDEVVHSMHEFKFHEVKEYLFQHPCL